MASCHALEPEFFRNLLENAFIAYDSLARNRLSGRLVHD